MTVMCPLLDTEPETTVRRLVDDFMADLEPIPDHWDCRVRVHLLAFLLAVPWSPSATVTARRLLHRGYAWTRVWLQSFPGPVPP